MQTEEIKINENVSLLMENPVNFKKSYLIYIPKIDNYLNEQKDKFEIKAVDKIEKQIVFISLNIFPYRDGYVLEDNNLYYKKLISNYLMEEETPFELISIPIKEYNELLFLKRS